MRGPQTQDKNSGWLRYTFGATETLPSPSPQFPDLTATVIVNCLGADADVTPDADNQIFGESPGHAAITGSHLFTASNLVQRDANPTGTRVQGDPNTGTGPAGGSRAGARIPAGSKVRAFFVASGAAGSPIVLVQTEVVQNRVYKAGVEDTVGPLWLSSIRVAVKVFTPNAAAAGTLYVEVQHSHLDIPGLSPQSQVWEITT